MLKYTEFKEELTKKVIDELANRGLANIEVSTAVETTPSGISDRLQVKRIGSRCSMSFRLAEIFKRYENADRTMEDVVEGICNTVVSEEGKAKSLDDNMVNFTDYGWCKERFALFALPLYSDTKKEYPTITVGSVEIGVRVCVNEDENGMSSFAVTKQMLKAFGVTKATLFKDAKACAPKKYELTFRTLGQVLSPEFEKMEEDIECPACIAFAPHGVGGIGASVIAYKDFFKKARERMRGSFYIIPSSVNELIVFPEAQGNRSDLTRMVRRVNEEYVPREEVLSNNAMYYNAETEELEIIDYEEA